MNHPSNIVLFNLRGTRGPSLVEKFGVKVSGRSDRAVDGTKYFELLLHDARKYGVEEILVTRVE